LLRNNTPCGIDEHAITVAIPASGDVIVILQWRRADHLAASMGSPRDTCATEQMIDSFVA
jgi:hypothetical protein